MSATLAPVIRQRFFTTNGAPLVGGLVYTYIAGTTTPQATYTDQSAGTPNANPIVLDANGEANIWFDPTLSYKVVLKDSGGVTQWTVDQVSGAGSTGVGVWNINSNYSQGAVVADSSGYGLLYVSLTNNNLGNALTSVANWRSFGGGERTVTSNTTLAVTDEIVRSNSTSGALTHTLPACSTTPIGKRITVKDVGTGGFPTTVKGAGTDQVDGAVTYATALTAKVSCTFANNGTSWDVVHGAAIPDGSVSSSAKMTAGIVTQDKLAARATGTTVAAGGVAISASSGIFSTHGLTWANITNLSVTITTTGRPVFVALMGDSATTTSLWSYITNNGNGDLTMIGFTRGGSNLNGYSGISVSGGGVVNLPPGAFWFIDTGAAAGTYTYAAQARSSGTGSDASVNYCKLIAYEL